MGWPGREGRGAAEAIPGSRVPLPLPKTGEVPLGNASVVVDEFPSLVVDPSGGR